MSKYLIELTRQSSSFIIEYDENGVCSSVKADYGSISPEALCFFWRNVPYSEAHIQIFRTYPNTRITELQEDLSFDRFWREYNHKLGKKKVCERIWENMPEIERAKAIKYITQYNQFLIQRPGIEKKYPETYLRNEQWNN